MRHAICIVLSLCLASGGAVLAVIEYNSDAPTRLWLAGPFLFAVWIGWLLDELRA